MKRQRTVKERQRKVKERQWKVKERQWRVKERQWKVKERQWKVKEKQRRTAGSRALRKTNFGSMLPPCRIKWLTASTPLCSDTNATAAAAESKRGAQAACDRMLPRRPLRLTGRPDSDSMSESAFGGCGTRASTSWARGGAWCYAQTPMQTPSCH